MAVAPKVAGAKKRGKQIEAIISLQVKAGEANAAPPIGPALGQRGVNIMEFCKAFNEQTKNEAKGVIRPVKISVYSDRSFTFVIHMPPVSFLLRQAAKINKGAQKPGTEVVAKVSKAQVKEIASLKQPDLTAASLAAAMRTVAGTARSMGIEVEENE